MTRHVVRDSWRGLALAVVVLLAACSNASNSNCPTGVVDTTSGKVCGVVQPVEDLSVDVDAFLGITLGASTAGANRFQPPVRRPPMGGSMRARSTNLPTGAQPAVRRDVDPGCDGQRLASGRAGSDHRR
jgi:hypothetical protein